MTATLDRPRISWGGPPRGARHQRSVIVLVARPTQPATTGQPDPHVGHRNAVRGWWAARQLERRVTVWQDPAQLGDGWRVAVFDGSGRLVDDYAPVPYDLDDAREVANAAVEELQLDPDPAAQVADPFRVVQAGPVDPAIRREWQATR